MTDAAITELAPLIGVRAACERLGAAQAGYYRRHRQSPAPPRPEPVPHRDRQQPRALGDVEPDPPARAPTYCHVGTQSRGCLDVTAHDFGDSRSIVDVHGHFFPPPSALPRWVTSDARFPHLALDDADRGRIMLGSQPFRQVRRELWDAATRVRALDASGIRLQLISPVPVMLAYHADGSRARDYARASNDATAAAVASGSGRLLGLGTLPLPDVDTSVNEMHRLVTELGLSGVEIGAQINGRELDDPALVPLFDAAEELACIIFVHPTGGGQGTVRREGQPYDFGLGMLTDTALAAGALVFGGVLERHPDLRVAMAHGCGTFPWALPRLAKGAEIFGRGDPGSSVGELVRRLWVDSLVFDPDHLRLLVKRFGTDHVMFGSDYPFFPGLLEEASAFLDGAITSAAVTVEEAERIAATNALAFLGRVETMRSPRPPVIR